MQYLDLFIKHNPFYKNIQINMDNLNALPEDGIPEDIQYYQVDGCGEQREAGPKILEKKTEGEENKDESFYDYDDDIDESFYPIPDLQAYGKTEEEKVNAEMKVNDDDIDWPLRTESPLNEYNTNGYFTRLFPHLFVTGEGDPTYSVDKLKTVRTEEAIDHLLKVSWKDNDGKEYYPFAEDRRFIFCAFNMLRRHQLNEQGSVWLKHHELYQGLSVEELEEKLNDKKGT